MINPMDRETEELELARGEAEDRAEEALRVEPIESEESVEARRRLAGARLKALKVEGLLARAIDEAFGVAGALAVADSAPRAAGYLRELKTYLGAAATAIDELETFAAGLPGAPVPA